MATKKKTAPAKKGGKKNLSGGGGDTPHGSDLVGGGKAGKGKGKSGGKKK